MSIWWQCTSRNTTLGKACGSATCVVLGCCRVMEGSGSWAISIGREGTPGKRQPEVQQFCKTTATGPVIGWLHRMKITLARQQTQPLWNKMPDLWTVHGRAFTIKANSRHRLQSYVFFLLWVLLGVWIEIVIQLGSCELFSTFAMRTVVKLESEGSAFTAMKKWPKHHTFTTYATTATTKTIISSIICSTTTTSSSSSSRRSWSSSSSCWSWSRSSSWSWYFGFK